MKGSGLLALLLAVLAGVLPLGARAAGTEAGFEAPLCVTITARKCTAGAPPKDGESSFRLLSEEGAVIQEAQNQGSSVTFLPLVFDREGIYRYYLKEIPAEGRELACDRAVYTVTVEVPGDGAGPARIRCLRNGKPWFGTPVFGDEDVSNPGTGDGIVTAFTVLVFFSGALGILLAFRCES